MGDIFRAKEYWVKLKKIRREARAAKGEIGIERADGKREGARLRG